MIEIKNLVKKFGDFTAVNDISFKVNKGELFAFLGLNGAGKSTTINMICGNLQKNSGEIFIDGVSIDDDMVSCITKLGVVYQTSVLDKALSVKDNLKSRAALYGVYGKDFDEKLVELSKLLELDEIMNKTFSKLSGGQKRRVDIARALLHNPQILILDEPTTGLDPQTRKMVWNVIDTLRKDKGVTVFLTTHYMEEAADADYVVILDSGKISAQGSPLELKNKYTGDFIYLHNTEEKKVKELNIKYEKVGTSFKLKVEDTAEATSLITKYPELFIDYEVMKGKMDDVFLAVTGKKLDGGENKWKHLKV